ncbi:MAG TPA: mannosyltransferase family protein [Thermoleophilaceae bacterium]|nr:mannosyltransferase family protein [Thermoleophilaceae bacterium]
MAFDATPTAARAVTAVRGSTTLRAAWSVFWTTRAAVLVVAVFAALSFGPATGGLAERNAEVFDEPGLTRSLAEPLLSPLARWDAAWYLRIAESGYGGSDVRAAFLPLYPLLVRAVAAPFGASPGALLVAAYAVSLAAFLGALVLLHRLVSLELGRPLAQPALLLLAVFPAAVFFGAPYAESLFLLLAVGAFYAARTGRWAWAGAAAAGAAATRSAGVLLLLPLAMLWWTTLPRKPGNAAWLLLAPLGLAAYAAFLGLAEGDAWRFLDVQDAWSRELTVPLAGAWDGLGAAADGARQLLSGQTEVVYFDEAAGDPYRIAAINLMLFGSLVFALLACVGCLRRLPKAYGVWVAASLVLPLTFPVKPQPLMSLPRFLAVLFPIFMWLALWSEERRATARVAAVSALGLGLFTAQFASWHWIS